MNRLRRIHSSQFDAIVAAKPEALRQALLVKAQFRLDNVTRFAFIRGNRWDCGDVFAAQPIAIGIPARLLLTAYTATDTGTRNLDERFALVVDESCERSGRLAQKHTGKRKAEVAAEVDVSSAIDSSHTGGRFEEGMEARCKDACVCVKLSVGVPSHCADCTTHEGSSNKPISMAKVSRPRLE